MNKLKIMLKNHFYLLYSLVFMLSIKAFTTSYENAVENVFRRSTTFLSAFSKCTIRIINYPGYNIDGTYLQQPIVLLRYFSFTDTDAIYPMEIRNFNYTKRNTYFQQGRHNQFAYSAFTYRFKNSYKTSNCETEILIEPPDRNTNAGLYVDYLARNFSIFKHPYHRNYFGNLDSNKLKEDKVDTLTIYSIMVTSTQMPSSECLSSTCQAWMNTAWMILNHIKINQHLFVWKISNRIEIFVHCKFCDPCRPYMFLQFKEFYHPSKTWLTYLIRQVHNRPKKLFLDVVLFDYISKFYYGESMDYSMKSTVKLMNLVDLKSNNILPKVTHPLTIMAIVPNNTTLRFVHAFASDRFSNKALPIAGCTKLVYYSPHLRLAINRHTSVNAGEFTHQELIIDKHQLRFLACHLEKLTWFSRLKELVTPFDLATTILGLASVLVMSLYMNAQLRLRQSARKFSFGASFEAVVALMLENGHQVFGWSLIRNKKVGYFIAFGIPYVLLVLSNEYRGDNISRLTVEPDLHPFDTFDELVRYRFPIYSLPWKLRGNDYNYILESVTVSDELEKISNHEYFPVVSRLWYDIMIRFYPWNKMKKFYARLGSRTRFYLQHSHIYGEQKILATNITKAYNFVDGVYKNWQEHAFEHLQQCNYSALILHQNQALIIYTKLGRLKAPVFYGKDIINENMQGYKLYGKMPGNIYMRAKLFFESGALEFWRKYFSYVLVVRTRSFASQKLDREETYGSGRTTNSAVNIMLFIPAIGLLLSLIMFLYETRNKIIEETSYVLIKLLLKRFSHRFSNTDTFVQFNNIGFKVTFVKPSP